MDQVPNFAGTYPLAGQRIGPAWRAAWLALTAAGGNEVPAKELLTVMCAAAQIERRTAYNLLGEARRAGLVSARKENNTHFARIVGYRIAVNS